MNSRSWRFGGLLALAVAMSPLAGFAAPLTPASRAEIDGLLARLDVSACDFNRNGSWYKPAQARAHLLTKLQYFEDRGMVQSTEQFIELAASNSSLSSQAYLVRCGGGAPVTSRSWLLWQLQVLRAAAGATKAP